MSTLGLIYAELPTRSGGGGAAKYRNTEPIFPPVPFLPSTSQPSKCNYTRAATKGGHSQTGRQTLHDMTWKCHLRKPSAENHRNSEGPIVVEAGVGLGAVGDAIAGVRVWSVQVWNKHSGNPNMDLRTCVHVNLAKRVDVTCSHHHQTPTHQGNYGRG